MCQHVQANGDKSPQKNSVPGSGSTSAPAAHAYNVSTFSIPAEPEPERQFDYDHRRTITILSQQRQWPQDIWVHSPQGRVLYQPAAAFELREPALLYDEEPAPETAQKTETNGASKSS